MLNHSLQALQEGTALAVPKAPSSRGALESV